MMRRGRQDELAMIGPNVTVIGKCPACQSVLETTKGQCSTRNDPGLGTMLCVGCPKKVGEARDGTDIRCGNRVYMRIKET